LVLQARLPVQCFQVVRRVERTMLLLLVSQERRAACSHECNLLQEHVLVLVQYPAAFMLLVLSMLTLMIHITALAAFLCSGCRVMLMLARVLQQVIIDAAPDGAVLLLKCAFQYR
jgi:hypothetical protein